MSPELTGSDRCRRGVMFLPPLSSGSFIGENRSQWKRPDLGVSGTTLSSDIGLIDEAVESIAEAP